jgi:hypothetical protein
LGWNWFDAYFVLELSEILENVVKDVLPLINVVIVVQAMIDALI